MNGLDVIHTTRHQDNSLKILIKGAMNMRNIKGCNIIMGSKINKNIINK